MPGGEAITCATCVDLSLLVTSSASGAFDGEQKLFDYNGDGRAATVGVPVLLTFRRASTCRLR